MEAVSTYLNVLLELSGLFSDRTLILEGDDLASPLCLQGTPLVVSVLDGAENAGKQLT